MKVDLKYSSLHYFQNGLSLMKTIVRLLFVRYQQMHLQVVRYATERLSNVQDSFEKKMQYTMI